MKKKIIIILCFLIVILLFLGIYKYSNNNESNFFVSSFIKNNSFETSFNKDVPYKKGDELEFSFILENDNKAKKEIALNFTEVKKQIDIKEIYVDGIKQNNIDKLDIDTNNAKQINIKGIAKNNKLISDNTQTKDINIIAGTKDIIETPPKEEVENKIDFTINSKNIIISNNSFSSNIDNLLIITFEKPEIVDFIMIGEKSIKPSYTEKNKIYLNIVKFSFETGEYFLALLLKNGNIIATDYSINFTFDKNKVNIVSITPKEIKNNLDRNIVLQGNGFKKIIGVQLSNSVILKKTSFEIINDMVMSVKIPAGLEVGTYHLNLMDINSIYELKNETFTIIN